MYKRFCHDRSGISRSSGSRRNELNIPIMKLMLVSLALVAVALAAPAPPPPDHVPQILRSEFNQEPEGAYVYSFETDNGIKRSETGELKETVDEDNQPHKVVIVRGEYSYTDSEGNPETITYYADETGFHAEGKSVPKSARR